MCAVLPMFCKLCTNSWLDQKTFKLGLADRNESVFEILISMKYKL